MNGVANSAKAVRPGQRGYSWEVMVGIFLAGLFLKATVYHARHMEGDEQIYRALVDQLSPRLARRVPSLRPSPLGSLARRSASR